MSKYALTVVLVAGLMLGLVIPGVVFAADGQSGGGPVLNPANCHYYEAIAVSEGILWPAANASAESHTFNGVQGHLVTITSQQETDFIVANFPQAVSGPGSNYYWTGGFQQPGSPEPDGGWQWVTGESFVYTNWATGEPNNMGGEDYLLFWNPSGSGKWNDGQGTISTQAGYIVEYEPPDTTPPEISVTVSPDVLWPPNHKMVKITATVSVDDNCDPDPSVILTSVVSNQPDNAKGNGDGNTINDIQEVDIGTEDYEFLLRAEKAGSGDGRVYIITYTATDAAGNSTSINVNVIVPHSKGKK
jgi:hypothetical protein